MSRRNRRRRRGGPGALAILFTLLACLALLGLVGGAVLWMVARGAPATPEKAGLVTPASLVRGVIVDPSGSNGGEKVARRDLATLAAVVEDWPGAAPDQGAAYAGSAGLDLTVRQIALNSYAESAQVAHITVPGVPELSEPPADLTDTDAYAGWLDHSDEVRGLWKQAAHAARTAADQLRAAHVRNEDSEIAGALSAMAGVLPPSDQPRTVVVISDVEQAGARQQVDGDLDGAALVVFHRCDAGAARCEEARTSFEELVDTLGGGRPQFLRVERLRFDLEPILKGQSA